MQWDWPVECTNMEGEAFCNWKGEKLGKKLRLISYEESYQMRDKAIDVVSNTNLSHYSSPAPVNEFYGFLDGEKVYDLAGNVWRHSCSVLTILEGFKPHYVYDDFTSPTIDGEHTHVLGGSWISMGNCANIESRYGFRPHFMQYAGIRYVCSENEYAKEVPVIFNLEVGKRITEDYTNFEIN